MSSRPIRIAVIGKGRWGRKIIKTLGTIPGCSVAYAAALDYKKLLKKNDIDAVVVATPASTHAAVALPFVKKGLPVFIEKPMTVHLADARRFAAASVKSKALIFVGHLHLYSPAYLALKKAVKKIGKVRAIIGEGASSGPFRDDVSAMWDWAPHDLAMILDIAGEKPASVQAWGMSLTRPRTRLHDITFLKLNFPSGIAVFVRSSNLSPEKKRSICVVGTKNSVIYDDAAEKKIVFFKGAGTAAAFSGKTAPAVSYPSYGTTRPLTEELKAFVAMIRTGKKPKTDVRNGIETIAILEAAERSIAGKGKIVGVKR